MVIFEFVFCFVFRMILFFYVLSFLLYLLFLFFKNMYEEGDEMKKNIVQVWIDVLLGKFGVGFSLMDFFEGLSVFFFNLILYCVFVFVFNVLISSWKLIIVKIDIRWWFKGMI